MESEGKKESLAKPDVAVTERAGGKKRRNNKGGVALAEPAEDTESVRMEAFIAEKFEESFVEIYAEDEERYLVTCIEILSPSTEAFDQVESWLAQPTAIVIDPSHRHLAVLRGLLDALGTAGNLVPDAHLAALAIEHGGTVLSSDRDFGRFAGVRWSDPLAG